MNRRLLSTTLPLSALIAATTFMATPASFAQSVPTGALPTHVLTDLLPGQALDADAEFNQGATAYNANDFDGAIKHFDNALKARSAFTDANYARGNAYEAKKDYKSAIADFTKVIAKKPKLYDAYVERGRSYALSGDFADAKTDLTMAATLKPERSDAYQVLGDAYFNNKDYENAITAYSKFISIQPQPDPLVFQNRGEANYSAKHYDAAILDFEKFAASSPAQAADTKLFLGDSYMQLKKYPDAIKAYTAYITAHPTDATGAALNSRALAELQGAEYKESVADYKAYLKIKPDDKVAYNNLIAAESKSTGVSLPELKEAIAHDPTNLPVRIQLAKALFEAKQYPEAITNYNQILTAKPDDYEDQFNRGLAYANSGDHTKALADFSAYTKVKPTAPLGWQSLGVEYGQQADWKDAVAAFSQYITLKPEDVEAYKNRGIAEYNLHDYKATVSDLKKYDASKPGDAQVGKLLTESLVQTGDAEGAISAAKIQTEKHPEDGATWSALGVAYVTIKKFGPATDAFTHAIALKKDETLLYNRGLAYYNLGSTDPGDYAKAAADATAALGVKPGYAEAQLLKADSEYADKKYKDAKADYTAYLAIPTITPDNKTYAEKQSLRAAIDDKDYASVITVTTALIGTNASDASNFQLRGATYVAQKNYDLAVPDLTKYTAMKPDDAEGWYNLGVAYSGKKDNANAAASFEKALSVKATYFEAANQAALAYKAAADADASDAAKCGPEYDKAIALFDKAATIKGTGKDATDALYNEATALEAKAKNTDTTDPFKLAVTVWTRYIAAAPNDPEIGKVKAHVDALKKQIAEE